LAVLSEIWLTFAEAYDIKLIMNKGVYDIIRPRWLFDSIANNELVPMSRKYFFHATAERMESEDYYNEDDNLESRSPEETSLRMSVSPGIPVDAEVSESKDEDSEMQEWLKIGPGSDAAENPGDGADSVTDPDSGNEDNWFNIEAPQLGGAEASGMEVGFCVSLGGWRLLGKTSSTPTMMSTSK
jgi:DNA ligase-4